ncbi:MAG: SDR family NAD(P)-dependent oxidoreductase [Candidatus Binatia bacterium]
MATLSFDRSVITGAGSGLGRALALRLARPGARLLLADINRDAVEETARLAEQGGAVTHAQAVDVADAAQVEGLAVAADRCLGRIDLVVNNAGVAAAGAIGEQPLADWRWIVDINLFGVIHGCHVFAPRLVRQGGGAILNTASLAGIASAPTMGAYNVTKAAVVALSETLAAEVGGQGVRVTVLCPAFFNTNLLASARAVDPELVAMARGPSRARRCRPTTSPRALRALERGKLYCLPMREGRVVWRLKRLMPERFVKIVSSARLQRLASRSR